MFSISKAVELVRFISWSDTRFHGWNDTFRYTITRGGINIAPLFSVLNYYKLMQPLTNNEYNEVCKSYENFGSKLFDEMFIGYDDDSVSYLYNQDYYFGGAK